MSRFRALIFIAAFSLTPLIVLADYLTPEEVRQQEEGRHVHQEEAKARRYVGKTFWYKPNPQAVPRVKFHSDIPRSVIDDSSLFCPSNTTSFIVTGVVHDEAENVYLREFFLAIKFPDGKTGFIKPLEIEEHLYTGFLSSEYDEYIYVNDPKRIAAERKKTKQKAAQAAKVKKAKGGVRIGMTQKQVLSSNWGKPDRVNKTITENVVHEQWIYVDSNYLYFENGILTTIQK